MRPSNFKIISLAKLEVSALFQSAQHGRNMFSYKNVNGTDNARSKDSKKHGNFQKNDFLPQNELISQYRKIPLFNENNTMPQQNHANSTFFRVKGTQIWPEKEANPFERLKIPRKFPIDNE